MKKYNSFRDLFADIERRDSYWSEKAITEFSVELYQLMRQRGLSKKDFAEITGKSQAYITKVFKGNANFTIQTMVKLTRALSGNLSLHVTPSEEKNLTWFRAVGKNKSVLRSKWGQATSREIITDLHAVDYQSEIGESVAS